MVLMCRFGREELLSNMACCRNWSPMTVVSGDRRGHKTPGEDMSVGKQIIYTKGLNLVLSAQTLGIHSHKYSRKIFKKVQLRD